MNDLGVMYAEGHGVPELHVVAYALFNLAGIGETTDNELVIKNRTSLAQTMSNKEIEAAQALSREMNKSDNVLRTLDAYIRRQQ